MFVFSTLKASTVLGLLIMPTLVHSRRPGCAARCSNKKTKVYKQSADGTSCQEKCIGTLFFPRRIVPEGYVCGSCPVFDDTRFNTDVDVTKVPSSVQSFFTDAAKRWEGVIKGELTDISLGDEKTQKMSHCYPYIPLVIDDLYICASIVKIDGPLKILGQAYNEFTRKSNNLPVNGVMEFDSADLKFMLDQGNFGDVILHEMGHVFGIGTLWQKIGLQDPQTCAYNLATKASFEWDTLTGCTDSIPVDTVSGPGTACGHWDEVCLGTELMTGFVGAGGDNPLSRMTVATLEDLGYTVDYSAADTYTIAMVDASCTTSACGATRRLRNIIPENKVHLTHHPNDRKLADDTPADVIAYAQGLLAANAANAASFGGLENDEGLSYVGHESVSVLYLEEGKIRSVVVHAAA